MADIYKIYGANVSPYSVKTRSYFRYKGIPHEWLLRNPGNIAEYQKFARLPLVPLVITPEAEGIQDSTPIIEEMERRVAEPSVYPEDATLSFISALIEEYGDEWGNKHMFHYRWWREVDANSCARRIAEDSAAEADEEQIAKMTKSIAERMVGRIGFVGSSETTKDQIEQSFEHELEILEVHFQDRLYLMGGRPAFADFGLFAQIHQASTDPTAGEIIRRIAPMTLQWAERMLDPKREGDFEDWASLEPTLKPLLAEQIGRLFLPWTAGNAAAIEAGEDPMTMDLDGHRWEQKPQKYHAKSLAALRAKYAAMDDTTLLDPILDETGCLGWLAA